MKKILVTTLALSLAMVSALDARQMKTRRTRRGRSQSLPVQQIAQKTEDMKDAQKAGDTKVAVQLANQVQNAVAADPKTAELWNVTKEIQAKRNEIDRLEEELKALKVSWFGSWTNTDYKSKNNEIKAAKRELANLRTRLKELTGEVGMATADTIKVAAGVADWYFNESGYMKAGYKYASESQVGKTLGGWVTAGQERWNKWRNPGGNTENIVQNATDTAKNVQKVTDSLPNEVNNALNTGNTQDAVNAIQNAANSVQDAANAVKDAADVVEDQQQQQ